MKIAVMMRWSASTAACCHAPDAITLLPYGRLVKGERMTVVMRDLVDECVAVAKAGGVTMPGNVDVAVHKLPRRWRASTH